MVRRHAAGGVRWLGCSLHARGRGGRFLRGRFRPRRRTSSATLDRLRAVSPPSPAGNLRGHARAAARAGRAGHDLGLQGAEAEGAPTYACVVVALPHDEHPASPVRYSHLRARDSGTSLCQRHAGTPQSGSDQEELRHVEHGELLTTGRLAAPPGHPATASLRLLDAMARFHGPSRRRVREGRDGPTLHLAAHPCPNGSPASPPSAASTAAPPLPTVSRSPRGWDGAPDRRRGRASADGRRSDAGGAQPAHHVRRQQLHLAHPAATSC